MKYFICLDCGQEFPEIDFEIDDDGESCCPFCDANSFHTRLKLECKKF